jgi:glycerol-3-phosphate dehydrogenase (NAD(P)+)
MRPIVVLGAGSWGTALAIQFARGGGLTVLWGRAEDEPERIARERENVRYLPGAKFPPALSIEPDLARALGAGDDVVLVVPSSALRAVLTEIKPVASRKARIAWASKGFELATGKLPHQVAREVLGPGVPTAVLSGPTFAKEVGQGLPTAIAVASSDEAFARELAERISSGGFRAYTQSDIVGVEIGGAVKNVLAIATGCSDGLGYGSNSRVFLITRGLAELMRLGVALGAKRETLMGLAGLGDLVLTCTDDQSRNRRFGRALAAGKPVDQAIAEIGQVVEGYHAAKAVHQVAAKHGVDMPICNFVYDVLHGGVPLEQVVRSMLSRTVTPEN